MVEYPAQRFCTKIYETLREQPGNLLISPLTLEILIGVIQNGARGETATEIEDAVAMPKDVDATQESFDTIMKIMKNDADGIVLEIANKIYIDSQFQLETDFRTNAQKEFLTDIESVNMVSDPQQSLKAMNMGVYRQTRTKVEDLFSEGDITLETKMVLVNALYFKGKWEVPFSSEETRKDTFFVTSAKRKEVDMMYCKSHYGYATFTDEKAKMVVMPYAGQKNFMVIILPDEIDGLDDVERKLPITKVMEAVRSATMPVIELWLPRFRIETKIDLKNSFESLGISSMFNPAKAELTGISKGEGLCVAKILQMMFIEVDEEGLEEAAAMTYPMSHIDSVPALQFRVDRPFVFLLLNADSDCVLFVGRVPSP